MNNINTARRQANSFTKAQTMTQEGYSFNLLVKNMYRIFKPGTTQDAPADYVVDLLVTNCTCPDFQKKGATCKHILWVTAEVEKQEDEAMWNTICAEYDAQVA